MTGPTPEGTPERVPGVGNNGGADLAAYVIAAVCVAFASVWAYIAFTHNTHSNFDDGLIGGCLLVAVILAAPANAQKAVAIVKPILPWGKRDA